jgi:hypothetical protein
MHRDNERLSAQSQARGAAAAESSALYQGLSMFQHAAPRPVTCTTFGNTTTCQ